MRPLDFIVIGAQKAGTTSFYNYVRSHPEIFLPASKDSPFFCNDDKYKEGWEAYAKNRFRGAGSEQKWGKVTAHYAGYIMHTPRRMRETMPGAKIVALLRNPIDRAFSHHQMQVYRNAETRSFREAVDDLLQDKALTKGRQIRRSGYSIGHEAERWCYLTWGEYGRILDRYLTYFEKDQIRIYYTCNLASQPEMVVQDFFSYVGVNDNFIPEGIYEKYHKREDRRTRQGGGAKLSRKREPFHG